MTDTQVLDLIKAALFEVAPARVADFQRIGLDTRIDALALDSISIMEMVSFIEDQIEVVFPEDRLAKVQNIGDLAGLIRNQAKVA